MFGPQIRIIDNTHNSLSGNTDQFQLMFSNNHCQVNSMVVQRSRQLNKCEPNVENEELLLTLETQKRTNLSILLFLVMSSTEASYANHHEEVKKYNLPNYLEARTSVKSQMNIEAWKSLLEGYWDQ